MTAILKIKGKDLTPKMLKKIQEQYGDRELEIQLSPTESISKFEEEDFWKVIDLLDWSKENNEQIVAPAIQSLQRSPIKFIYQFYDFLSKKLHDLDGEKYARHIGEDSYSENDYFSVDNFLYARCCVVANGKAYYEEVKKNPKKMPKDLTFEPILYLATKAYRQKTGQDFDYIPLFNFETYANQNAWT